MTCLQNREDPDEDLYKLCKILKFRVSLQNCFFMYKLEGKELAKTFAGLTHTGEQHKYSPRSINQNFLDIPLTNTEVYGASSNKIRCKKD